MADWVQITPVDALPDGRGVRVDVAGRRIAVFRLGSDVHAVGDLCSHAEASLAEGEVYDHEVECPRHGAEFDLMTGAPSSLPATKPVPVYQTKVEGGNLFLLLDDREES